MKNILLIVALLAFSFSNAQAFEGKGDQKFQVGANIQDSATGINVSFDHGLGENISVGVSSSYSLGGTDAIDDNFDFYPGLNLSLKNFGGHLGARYFFSEGFGVYTEANFPLAKYDNDEPIDIHNQFTLNLGAVFNL